jgi:large subunit ribosomal protein L6
MPLAAVLAARSWHTSGEERAMSRIGKQPIEIPNGVEVQIASGNVVTVSGPRGALTRSMHTDMRILNEDGQVRVERPDDDGFHRGLRGLTRSLVANMVEGVTKGFEKRLAVVGVGYRVALKGKDLEIQVGYSHPVVVPQPEGIEFEVPIPTSIVVRGNDKEQVGEVAANIRKIRKPEPYKGKGIRYENEYVRKKAGKAAKGTA